MHRLGGQKIQDIQTAQKQWIEEGRSPSTLCNKNDWDTYQEDLGELVTKLHDGTEIRKHASIKDTTRGGSYKIAHNRVIVGNPTEYVEWQQEEAKQEAAGVPLAQRDWMARWTYYPAKKLQEIIDRHQTT